MAAEEEGKPPVLGSWRALHGFVLGVLVVLIALFTLIAMTYR